MGIAVFAAGAVLLGVEIAASRVLAPAFGNSIFVWGSLIGVVLAAGNVDSDEIESMIRTLERR